MVVVGDSFQSGSKLIGRAVVGDLVDEILQVDVSGLLQFAFTVGIDPYQRGLLVID
jgi:hypothetical protein